MATHQVIRTDTMNGVVLMAVIRRIDPRHEPFGIAAQDPHAGRERRS